MERQKTIPRPRNPAIPARETLEQRRRRAREVARRLHQAYPEAKPALVHDSPFQLLIATILSAQATDEKVNEVAKVLFRRYPDPESLARAPLSALEAIVKPTGFYRNKARNIRATAKAIVERFGGEVPRDMDALITLPGVARKTANVVLGNAFGIAAGFVVDTHVGRIARRMGFTREWDAVKVERDLMKVFPRSEWIFVPNAWIWHGRRVCTARRAWCGACVLADVCPQRVEPERVGDTPPRPETGPPRSVRPARGRPAE